MGPLEFGHEASSWCDPSRGRQRGRRLFSKPQSEPRPPICMRGGGGL